MDASSSTTPSSTSSSTSAAIDPDTWATDVVIADGGVVRLRPLVRADAEAMLDLAARLSDETVYLRFLSYDRPRTLERLSPVIRCPTPRVLPSFLTSMWSSWPGTRIS